MDSDMEYSDDDDENALTLVDEDKFSLILQEYDGKGIFAMQPHVVGLSKIIHEIPRRKLNQTLRSVLTHFVDLRKFEHCLDTMNLVTDECDPVFLDKPVALVFLDGNQDYTKLKSGRSAKIFFQNREYLADDFDGGVSQRKFEIVGIIASLVLIVLAVLALIAVLQDTRKDFGGKVVGPDNDNK